MAPWEAQLLVTMNSISSENDLDDLSTNESGFNGATGTGAPLVQGPIKIKAEQTMWLKRTARIKFCFA